jgi:hypothetical protein
MKRVLAVVGFTAVVLSTGVGAASAEEEVIVPSYPIVVGPVSTSTPQVTREEREGSWEECVTDPEVSPTYIGCPR